MTQTHAFVSFAHADLASMRRLLERLHAANVATWTCDEGLAPGTLDWELALRAALEASYAVVLVASPAAARSIYVRGEVSIAATQNLPVLAAWMEGDTWEDSAPLMLVPHRHFDCRGDHFEQGCEQLSATLRGLQEQRLSHATMSTFNVGTSALRNRISMVGSASSFLLGKRPRAAAATLGVVGVLALILGLAYVAGSMPDATKAAATSKGPPPLPSRESTSAAARPSDGASERPELSARATSNTASDIQRGVMEARAGNVETALEIYEQAVRVHGSDDWLVRSLRAVLVQSGPQRLRTLVRERRCDEASALAKLLVAANLRRLKDLTTCDQKAAPRTRDQAEPRPAPPPEAEMVDPWS